MKRKTMLFVLVFLLMSMSVKAQTMGGDDIASASGSTSVTARVEMPEEAENPGIASGITSGDDSAILVYAFLLVLSALVFVAGKKYLCSSAH